MRDGGDDSVEVLQNRGKGGFTSLPLEVYNESMKWQTPRASPINENLLKMVKSHGEYFAAPLYVQVEAAQAGISTDLNDYKYTSLDEGEILKQVLESNGGKK